MVNPCSLFLCLCRVAARKQTLLLSLYPSTHTGWWYLYAHFIHKINQVGDRRNINMDDALLHNTYATTPQAAFSKTETKLSRKTILFLSHLRLSQSRGGHTALSLGDRAPLACFRSFHPIHVYIAHSKHDWLRRLHALCCYRMTYYRWDLQIHHNV